MQEEKNSEKINKPTRFISFVKFFKNYMNVSALITACLPIPANYLNLIPVFEEQKGILTVYTSLFCFLLLGFLFYIRIPIARLFFGEFIIPGLAKKKGKFQPTFRAILVILPLLFICLSFYSMYMYHQTLNQTFKEVSRTAAVTATRTGRYSSTDGLATVIDSSKYILFKIKFPDSIPSPETMNELIFQKDNDDNSRMDKIYDYRFKIDLSDTTIAESQKELLMRQNTTYILKNYIISSDASGFNILLIDYFCIFFFAEVAFILMALREYMQDLLQLDELTILRGFTPL